MNALTLITGFGLALAIALLAWRANALAASGAVAATIAGTLAVAAGWSWAALLIAFFVSSTVLGRLRRQWREQRVAGRIAKGGRRDAIQVLANGGTFLLAAGGSLLYPHAAWQLIGIGSLATSAADTWATEIGTLAKTAPRSVLTWQPVDVGTSGGVTLVGSAAGIAGAAFIGVVGIVVGWPGAAVVAAIAGGVVGCLVDSMLGAALQARRWCATCRMATEMPMHTCGTATTLVGGLRWLDNDGVNAISSLTGALVGAGVMLVG
jgi:uncharacterized protein (TIGR00297 family)